MMKLDLSTKEQVCKTMRFDKDLWAKVRDESIRLNVSQNGLVRAILNAYFAEQDKEG